MSKAFLIGISVSPPQPSGYTITLENGSSEPASIWDGNSIAMTVPDWEDNTVTITSGNTIYIQVGRDIYFNVYDAGCEIEGSTGGTIYDTDKHEITMLASEAHISIIND